MRSKPKPNVARMRDFNKYSVGNVVYPGGSPNKGMKLDPTGYKERDTKNRVAAARRRLMAKKQGRLMSSDYLKPDVKNV